MRTRIKICGITEMTDAKAAVEAGVDALGFIFAEKSPRRIDPQKAREIIAALPPFVDAVGVFVNEYVDVVEEIVQYCRLTMVQLHGGETPEYCDKISCRVMKSFSISAERVAEGAVDFKPYVGVVEAFLLDTWHSKVDGGTGETFDWDLVAQLQPPGPIVLAGGLNPDNVADSIRMVRPFAVDLNSGLESEPGRKDHEAIARAVTAVRGADALR